MVFQTANEVVVRCPVYPSLTTDPLALRFEQLRCDRSDNRLDDFVLEVKQFVNISVIPLSHQVMAGAGIDQLCRDADPLPPLSDAALDDVTCAQTLAHRLNICCAAFKGEGRTPSDDRKKTPTSKLAD